MSEALKPATLVPLIASSLPQDDTESIKTPLQAISLAVHVSLISVGFKLIGLGDDNTKLESTENPPVLPLNWSPHFRYSHTQSSLTFIVQVSQFGSSTIDVRGLAEGDDRITSFNVKVLDFISPSSLPLSHLPDDDAERNQAIQAVFITPARLEDLAKQVQVHIIQPLAPGIRKDGYQESSSSASSTAPSRQQRSPAPTPSPAPFRDPNQPQNPSPNPNQPAPLNPYGIPNPNSPMPQRNPDHPDFDDDLDMLRHHNPRNPPRNPLSIGHDDLYPAGMGPHDPFAGGGGIGPAPGFGSGGLGGGMYPDFGTGPHAGVGGGAGGGLGNPQVPPGARFDARFPGDPLARRGGGAGGGGFGGGFGGFGPGGNYGFGGDII